MNPKTYLICLIIVLILIGISEPSEASPLSEFQKTEFRYCGEPDRYPSGRIKRSSTLVRLFIKMYPLPEHLNRSDWSVDHVIPLANGGCDAIINLQWLPNSIKRTSDDDNKDRWERKIYPKLLN